MVAITVTRASRLWESAELVEGESSLGCSDRIYSLPSEKWCI